MDKSIERDVKLSIIFNKYKCTSAYIIPDNISEWINCPNCGLKPLVWEFDNGRSTGCGCGENEYNHFSINSESIMSIVSRNGGSSMEYDPKKLMINWNHWCLTGEDLEPYDELRKLKRW